LKGGGPNFGIVTRYDLFTVPIHDIWYRGVIYKAGQAVDLLEAFASWQINDASDSKSNIAIGRIFNAMNTATAWTYSLEMRRPLLHARLKPNKAAVTHKRLRYN
jgi:hypothetical protein